MKMQETKKHIVAVSQLDRGFEHSTYIRGADAVEQTGEKPGY